jgi:hypothetical protein
MRSRTDRRGVVLAAVVRVHHEMATIEDRVAELSELRRAHQEALNALLRMRLEDRNGEALATAMQHAQRAADLLFAARLDHEQIRPAPLPLERSA